MSPATFAAAAILLVATALVHSIAGEKFILIRLFRRELPHLFGDDTFTKATLRFVWHAVSIAWLAMAAMLVMIPAEGEYVVGVVTIVALLATAALTIVISKGRHLSWLVEIVAAGLLLLGIR